MYRIVEEDLEEGEKKVSLLSFAYSSRPRGTDLDPPGDTTTVPVGGCGPQLATAIDTILIVFAATLF
ncbi:hypothetical protein GN956_G8204 [Arapaima gigas]